MNSGMVGQRTASGIVGQQTGMVGQQGNSDTTNSKNRTAKDEQQKKFAPIHTGMSQPKTIYLEYVASIFKEKKPSKKPQ